MQNERVPGGGGRKGNSRDINRSKKERPEETMAGKEEIGWLSFETNVVVSDGLKCTRVTDCNGTKYPHYISTRELFPVERPQIHALRTPPLDSIRGLKPGQPMDVFLYVRVGDVVTMRVGEICLEAKE